MVVSLEASDESHWDVFSLMKISHLKLNVLVLWALSLKYTFFGQVKEFALQTYKG
jgi:hypothetical protein